MCHFASVTDSCQVSDSVLSANGVYTHLVQSTILHNIAIAIEFIAIYTNHHLINAIGTLTTEVATSTTIKSGAHCPCF